VLSQAFDRRLPIVEANSLRVLARLFGYPGDPREGAGKTWVWAAAEAVLPARRAGDFNQSLMELGALVCSPADPACDRCPVAAHCVANRDGLQAVIPPKKAMPAVTAVREAAVVVRDGGRVLFCRRPADARWANMWEFPHAEVRLGEPVEDAARRIAAELTGLAVDVGAEVLTVRHGVTRFAITLTAFEAARTGGEFRSAFYPEGRWLEPAELASYPTGTAQRKLIEEVARAGRQKRLF
jgi:A/G-specific adenine glycosylase